jgi:hypothetical protein
MYSQTHDARWVSFGPAVCAFRIPKATAWRLAMTWVLFVCALPLTAMAGSPVAVFKGSFSRLEDRSTDSRRIAGGCFVVFDVEAKTHTQIIFYERAGEKLYAVDSFTQDTFTVTGPEGRRKITFADARVAGGPGDLRRAYHEIGGIQKQLAITGGPGNDKPITVVFPRTLTGIQLQNFPDSSGDLHLRQQLTVTVQSQMTELANKAGRSEAEVVANLQAQLEARGYVQD